LRGSTRQRTFARSWRAALRLDDVAPLLMLCLLLRAIVPEAMPQAYAADDIAIQRAPLQLMVNDVDKGVSVVLLRGGEVLVDVDDLAKAGLAKIGGVPETVAGKRYVALGPLAPGVKYEIDQVNLALRLTVDPNLLAANKIDLQQQLAPENLTYQTVPGGFLNYAFSGQRIQNQSSYSAFTEQGVSLDGAFFDNNLTAGTGTRVSRTSTSLTFDDRDKLTRLVLGDSTATLGSLGGTSPIGGVSFSTQFAVNPYFVPFPGQTFAGIVNTPSTADVYVNGQLVRSIELPPGPFNLQNLPVTNGAGVTRVVIRNALGQTQELGAPFYQSTTLLREGLQQFTYNLGMEHDLGAPGFGHYIRPAFLASHSFGLTDAVTPGAFLEADRHVLAAGPNLTVALPLGQVALLAAGSHDTAAGSGVSSSLEYSYQALDFSAGVDLTYESSHYATISVPGNIDRPLTNATGFFSMPFGLLDVTLQVSHEHFRDAGRNDQASLGSTYQLSDRIALSAVLSESRSAGQPVNNALFVALNFALGERSSATASVNHAKGVENETAQIQQSLPLGEGFGYRGQLQTGPHSTQIGDVQYQGKYGLYEAEYDQLSGQDTERVNVGGGVVAVGGDIFATRAITDSFALVRVADLKGVATSLNGQPVGKTDRNGELMIPSMTSYLGSRIDINDQTVPSDYTIDATERVVATSLRGAAIVDFPVHRQRALVGTIVIESGGKTVVPSYGDLTVTAGEKPFTSPIGAGGEFYLDSLPSGSFPAVVTYADGECRFTLAAPATQDHIIKLGQLTCRQ
jgi:outer membrane usher protein